MNPMFNEYKDAGKIQEALLIGRNMVNKAPGDSECVNAYLDFLLMLAEKLPRTDERKSFADQANLVLSFYEENADLTDDIINDIHVYHNRLGAVVTDIAQLEQEECDAFDQPAYKFLHGFKGVVQINLLWQLHWQERKDFDFFFFHCVPPNKNRTIQMDCPVKSEREHPKILPSR